jgi:hypothetical protein
MRRTLPLLAAALLLSQAGPAHADVFDRYTNQILAKVPGAPGVKKVERLTPAELAEHSGAVPGLAPAFLVVKTNEGRFAKVLAVPARQKISDRESLPVLQVERFVTYREGEEKTTLASGQNVRLFAGFRLSLDIGQVVPEALGGDLRFVVEGRKEYVEPVGKAELYLLTKPIPEAAPKKGEKVVIGAAFEARYFAGKYKLYDDGRRSGTLVLKVGGENEITGAFYSDKDGQKYEVSGKVGTPAHAVQFKVTFPRTVQQFQGWMFTGDGRAITGSSTLQGRETGFYAVRTEE